MLGTNRVSQVAAPPELYEEPAGNVSLAITVIPL